MQSQDDAVSRTQVPPQPVAEGAPAARVDPDAVMSEVNRPRMGRMLAIAAVFHAALIGLTSISFLGLCWKYKTFHPKWKIKQEQKVEAEKQEAAAATKAAEEAVKRAMAARKGTADKEFSDPSAGKGKEPASAKEPGAKKSAVEKAVTATSKDRPEGSSLKLDELDLK